MKYVIVLMAVVLTAMSSMQAQRSNREGGLRQNNTAKEDRMQDLDKKLNLTNNQEVKVTEIRKETKQKVNAIRNDNKLTDEQKKVQLRSVVKEGQLKKSEVLTPTQQKIMSEEMRNRKRDK